MNDDILKLEDFFPGYPVLNKPPGDIFDLYNGKSYDVVNYLKKEFNEVKLEASEDIVDVKGTLLRHQKFISRFMSPRTMNDEILLYHAPGTGKNMQ